jgi:tight adherence protein C
MPASVSIVIVGAIVFIVMAFLYAFSGGSVAVADRLGRLWEAPDREGMEKKGARRKVKEAVLSGLTKILPSSRDQAEEADQRLIYAGFRRPEAATLFRVMRVALIVTLVGLVYVTRVYKLNPILFLLLAAVLGFMLPDIWLGRRVNYRQQLLRLGLPDALDLLVICMEAGLGLDQAMMYVTQEMKIAHRELCDEFDLVNAEMRVGKTRLDAFRSLATRTGVDDLQSLVATLIQTDRFGTSIAKSLRVHSDDLRTKRRQRAEELAAKTTVKMLFPLVFFIFPPLFVVILGPAIISMVRMMGQLR